MRKFHIFLDKSRIPLLLSNRYGHFTEKYTKAKLVNIIQEIKVALESQHSNNNMTFRPFQK